MVPGDTAWGTLVLPVRPTIRVLALVAFMSISPGAWAAETAPLPRPAALEPAITFWTRVFSEIEQDQGFIHDDRYLDVVYEVVQLPAGATWRGQQATIRAARDRYRRLLEQAASGAEDADPEIVRLRTLWRERAESAAGGLAGASARVRFQRGLADRFRLGLSRSGAWRDYIRDTLVATGVPQALTALPHVESSFDPSAYSHADAAGLWQFTVPTGRRFMQIDHIVDERLDPYLSTRAAARLLRYNHEVTGSWPLAVTAYNHGVAGVQRAVARLGTRDIGEIVWRYRGPGFGFASRNFYAAFLAAADVEARAESLFGPVPLEAPREHQVVHLPDYVSVRTLANALGIEAPLLRAANPALLEPVWTGQKHWPRNFPLRVPASAPVQLDHAVSAIPAWARHNRQVPDRYHQIAPGDSLSRIAARHDTSVATLMRLNDLPSAHHIRAGARLRLPGAGMAVPEARPTVALLPASSTATLAGAPSTPPSESEAPMTSRLPSSDPVSGVSGHSSAGSR